MTYAEFFSEIKGKFMEADVSDVTEHLAYQFNIIGDAEGIFYVEVKDGHAYLLEEDKVYAWKIKNTDKEKTLKLLNKIDAEIMTQRIFARIMKNNVNVNKGMYKILNLVMYNFIHY